MKVNTLVKATGCLVDAVKNKDVVGLACFIVIVGGVCIICTSKNEHEYRMTKLILDSGHPELLGKYTYSSLLSSIPNKEEKVDEQQDCEA